MGVLNIESVGVVKNINLTNKRKEHGLTQVEVAEMASVTNRAYQNYEAGERIPRADVAIRIAEALNSSVEELFK